jgi:hypothetical protein
MAFHRKRKIEIIVEKTFAPRMIALLGRHGAKGYSVLPVLADEGRRGYFGGDELTGIAATVMIIAIVPGGSAEAIEKDAREVLEDIRAVIAFSDVDVIRDDYF